MSWFGAHSLGASLRVAITITVSPGHLFAARFWRLEDARQVLRHMESCSRALQPQCNTRPGVVLGDRYARNPSGKLSHSRKELLVRPIRPESYSDVVSNCPEQLWVIDKSPDVLLWSAKARKWVV